MTLTYDFEEDPFIQKLLAQIQDLVQRVSELEVGTAAWVTVEVAMEITGLSATSLWRERKKPDTVIKCKQDYGLRYERASLLAYNKTRTEVKSRGRRQS